MLVNLEETGIEQLIDVSKLSQSNYFAIIQGAQGSKNSETTNYKITRTLIQYNKRSPRTIVLGLFFISCEFLL